MSSNTNGGRMAEIPEPLAQRVDQDAQEERRTWNDQLVWIVEQHYRKKDASGPPTMFTLAKGRRR